MTTPQIIDQSILMGRSGLAATGVYESLAYEDVHDRTSLLSLALLVYDTILCFNHEWNLVWSKLPHPLSVLPSYNSITGVVLFNGEFFYTKFPTDCEANSNLTTGLICFFVPIFLTITAAVLDTMDYNTSSIPGPVRAGAVASIRDSLTAILISRFLLQLSNLQVRKENEQMMVESHDFSGVITTGVPSFRDVTSDFYEANMRFPSNARGEGVKPAMSHQSQCQIGMNPETFIGPLLLISADHLMSGHSA
ncbi:uncharacterized protein BXZ73DRAFT_109210 [Epithele typhae]|uniref:uncharacterized protein n=1 Tax=Epithele typhae TaxID=378194 RepID=UPI002007AC22|nr:uncharacterized protein BXZ73DRAFT_109210 [Epithele typhae]KAH9910292.1 hypothetical protein BXZ73DRAFT_109210 [Epithele typhae]